MLFSLSIGVGFDKDGQPVTDVADKLDAVVSRVVDAFGGCSALNGNGSWKDDAGKVVSEPCVILQIIAPDGWKTRGQITAIAVFAQNTFNHSSVLLVRSECSSIFKDW
jgi:hypothetical protein